MHANKKSPRPGKGRRPWCHPYSPESRRAWFAYMLTCRSSRLDRIRPGSARDPSGIRASAGNQAFRFDNGERPLRSRIPTSAPRGVPGSTISGSLPTPFRDPTFNPVTANHSTNCPFLAIIISASIMNVKSAPASFRGIPGFHGNPASRHSRLSRQTRSCGIPGFQAIPGFRGISDPAPFPTPRHSRPYNTDSSAASLLPDITIHGQE